MGVRDDLLIQLALRGGLTLDDIQGEPYKLLVRRHAKYNNLVLFKYDQLDSPLSDPLVQQCRGLILDEADDWKVISRPFDKFFNYGEGHAAEIDWSTAKVQEKLDGSLIQLYWYDGEWQVGTSGTPDASGMVNGHDFTFAELFWRVWNAYKWPLPGGRHLTFMFELMTPYNRVVINHKGNYLKLIGVRDSISGKEYQLSGYANMYEPVIEFSLQSLDEILSTFDTIDPVVQEGYVIVDDQFNRIKVKHPGYVALHHMIEGFGPKRVLEVIRNGEHSEVVANFPEWKEEFDRQSRGYDSLISSIESVFQSHKDIENQKDFALKVKDFPFSGTLFSLRKGKTHSIKESLKEMQIDRLYDLIQPYIHEDEGQADGFSS